MKTVIFACVHNAGRSQMAAAFFNKLTDRPTAEPCPLEPPLVIAFTRRSSR